jgi:hypothetical protein
MFTPIVVGLRSTNGLEQQSDEHVFRRAGAKQTVSRMSA